MKDQTDETESLDVDEIDMTDAQLDTLSGDLRDAMLMRFRDVPKSWPQMTEEEQTDIANGFDQAARHAIRHTVRMLTDWEWPRCIVRLGDVAIKAGDKGIEAKITAFNVEENRNVLGDHVGQTVMLLMVDSDTFMGERGPAEIDPNQAELPTGDEAASTPADEEDLLARAVAVVREHGKASTSFIQRQLAIGYNKAARLIEQMEADGVVSAADHIGKRTVLASSEAEDA